MSREAEIQERLYQTALKWFDLVHKERDFGHGPVIVWTLNPASPELEAAIREYCRTASGREQLVVQFARKHTLSEDEAYVSLRADDIDQPDPGLDEIAPLHYDLHVLTVEVSGEVLAYALEFRPDWRPFGRFDPGAATPHTGVLLRADLGAVPHQELLRYRLYERGLELRRTDVRTRQGTGSQRRVEVRVHGAALPPGGIVELALDVPTILEYVVGDVTTTAVLHLTPAHSRDLISGSTAAPVSDAELDLRCFGTTVHVRPPERGTRVRLTDFAIPTPATHRIGNSPALLAQVLICGGTDEAGREWHVKMYRCVTAAHARTLRDTLTRQAALAEKARTAGGRAALHELRITNLTAPDAPFTPTRLGPSTDVPDAQLSRSELLATWFGVPSGSAVDSYVVALSPTLKTVRFEPRHDNPEPVVHQLEYFVSLAAGLDSCHLAGVVHGDIKAENLCRVSPGQQYILVDGDSINVDFGEAAAHRTTWQYAAPSLLQRAHDGSGRDAHPLRTNDRFAFGLLVLAAVAGTAQLDELTYNRPWETRPADRADTAAAAIAAFWGPEWSEFALVLATGLDEAALREPTYRLADWLARLQAAKPADDEHKPPRAEAERYGAEIEQLHAAIAGKARNTVDAALRRALTEQRRAFAAREYWQLLALGAGIALAFLVCVAIFVLGVF